MSDVIDKPPEVLPVVKATTQRPPLYRIFLSHSGDVSIEPSGFYRVPEGSYNILREVFNMDDGEATAHLKEVIDQGLSKIFESTKEVCESKFDQANSARNFYLRSNKAMEIVHYILEKI